MSRGAVFIICVIQVNSKLHEFHICVRFKLNSLKSNVIELYMKTDFTVLVRHLELPEDVSQRKTALFKCIVFVLHMVRMFGVLIRMREMRIELLRIAVQCSACEL